MRLASAPSSSRTGGRPSRFRGTRACHINGRFQIDPRGAHDAGNANGHRQRGTGEQLPLPGDHQPSVLEYLDVTETRSLMRPGGMPAIPVMSLTSTQRSGVFARTNVLTTAAGRWWPSTIRLATS